MKLKTAFLAALAALPLLAGTASAHGGYGYGPAPGYAPPPAHDWRADQARRYWAWRRHEAREHQRFAPPVPHGVPGPWGPRW